MSEGFLEKKEYHVTENDVNTLRINISGTIFQVEPTTLLRFPDSRLGKLVSGEKPTDKKTYFFDQDATLFGHILRCYRSGEVHVPSLICPREFLRELQYWNIPVEKIAPCCWSTFYRADDVLETLEKVSEVTTQSEITRLDADKLSLQERVWRFIDEPYSSKASTVGNLLIVIAPRRTIHLLLS